MSPYSRITGTGSYLPPRRVTNDDLAKELAARGIETSDQWIVERTGIRARHFAAPDVTSSDLGLEAARHALEAAGRQASDIDLIIVATSTPDMVFPSAATILQHKLGIAGCPAFDVQAVCSGFVYALTVADAMIRTGSARCALVVGRRSVLAHPRLQRPHDLRAVRRRRWCGGAGGQSETPGILASDLHADGKHVGILCVPGTVSGGKVLGTPLFKMDGQAVFKLAVGVLEERRPRHAGQGGQDRSRHRLADPAPGQHPHHAGHGEEAEAAADKLVVTVDQHGNTSAASIPLALDAAVRSGKVKKGDTLMLEGVGGGFTWGAVLLDF
jgi:3-oxoacyl-[acyl-carrier-protein] synthase-3